MVEQSCVVAYRLAKQDFDKKSKLTIEFDYFECPICMDLSEDIIECLDCKARACPGCLYAYNQKELQNGTANKKQSKYKCTQCLKVGRHSKSNKFLLNMLNEFEFKCGDCKRNMKLSVYKTHKAKGLCFEQNNEDDLSQSIAQSTLMIQNDQPNEKKSAVTSIEFLYILERDSKNVLEYNLRNNKLSLKQVDIPHTFAHNFQYTQTPSGKLFLVGGGDFQKNQESLKSCYEIIKTNGPKYACISRDKLKFVRHGHSICNLGSKFLVVTGSRLEQEDAHMKCEQYNIDIDLWFDMPALNQGRHYHASCSFKDRYVFVFCGIANVGKKYVNTIERYDQNMRGPWEMIRPSNQVFPERQGVGVAQMNNQDILIFGGFSGRYLKDAYYLNAVTRQVRRADQNPTIELFTYQMPTIYDEATSTVVTSDWQKMIIVSYNQRGNWQTVKDLKQQDQ